MAEIFSGSGWSPSAEMMCPRYRVSFLTNWHLEGLIFRLALRSLSKTAWRRFRCSEKSGEKINISSRYMRQISHVKPERICSITRWKGDWAFTSPKGRTLNSYSPPLEDAKAVLGRSSGAISTCQYPLVRSSDVKYFDPARASKESSTRGSG